MTDMQTDAPAEALTTEALRERYDELIDKGFSTRTRHVRPEEVVTQRSKGHELITRLDMEGLEVVAVERDDYDRVEFTLRDGVIRQHVGLDGFETQAVSRKGQFHRVGAKKDADPVQVVRLYVDEVVPEAVVANRIEEDEARKRRERDDALKAEDDAIIAAYEGLPADMRTGLKALIAYVALMERRSNRGFQGGGPPIANMLLMNLERAERGAMPEFDPRNAGRAFHW
jgi:hypothetical protein